MGFQLPPQHDWGRIVTARTEEAKHELSARRVGVV